MKIEKPQKEKSKKSFEFIESGTVCLVDDDGDTFYAVYISGDANPILYDLEGQTYYTDVDDYTILKTFENSILKIQ
jgi:hypothetical protein